MVNREALAIVLNMARRLYNHHGEWCLPAHTPAELENAFEIVEAMVFPKKEDKDNDAE